MRKIRNTVIALILFLCGTAVWAETTFTIAPVVNWSWADLREYVITYPDFDKLSELDWDAHNIMQYGMKTELTYNRFVVTADFAVAPETECGYMQDMDWFFADPSEPNPNNYPVDTLTHFSEHPVKVLGKDKVDFRAGWKIVDGKVFGFTLGGGFQYLNVHLHGYDGYLQYPEGEVATPYTSDREKIYIYGPGISYRQKTESLWVDMRFDFTLGPHFAISAEGGISPWQKIDCYDTHHQRNIDFLDQPHSFLMYSGQLSTLFSFGKRSCIILSGGIEGLPYTEGNDLVWNSINQDWSLAGVLGGTDYLGWDVSLSYRIRIF